jgi:uncharacterized protein
VRADGQGIAELIDDDRDRDTMIKESYEMFRAAKEPKELWVVHGARHVDLYAFVGDDYKIRVLAFFNHWLRQKNLQKNDQQKN